MPEPVRQATSEPPKAMQQAGAGLAFDMFQVSPEVFYGPGPDWWVAFAGGERPAAMHVRGMFVDAIARRLP